MRFLRSSILLLTLAAAPVLEAQTVIYSQSFDVPATCTNWGYTGGMVNNETRRTGTNSARVGRVGEPNLITFNTVNVAGLAGLQLQFYHSVRTGSGPGMDTDEGAMVQVQVNGGPWTMVDDLTGWGDYNWAWTATSGGNPSSGCLRTMPNPLVYSIPAGTNTIALRVFSTGSCPVATPSSYNRTDEGLFIDDVQITTTTAPLPYIWSGAVDTDWHKCGNWRYGVVPGLTSNVTIDQTAVNHCEVYTANAQCASLALSTNNVSTWNLTVRTARTLNVTNAVTVTRTGAGGAVGITLGTSGTGSLVCGSLTLTGSAPGNETAFLRDEAATNGLQVRGNVTINSGGLVDLEGAAVGGLMQVWGDWTNNDGESAFDDQFSLVMFASNLAQSVNTTGFTERFGSIRMAKTAGDFTLNDPISYRTNLFLSAAVPGGRILSSAAALFTAESTAAAAPSAPSDGSHVDGPVRHFGATNYTFPIGKDGIYRPAQITEIAGSATDAFTAEYFHVSAISAYGPLTDPFLDHVSDCEHWTVVRSSGTPNARVTLSWHNVHSCGVTDPASLRVGWWDAAAMTPLWRDRGNFGTTTTAWGGWLPTSEVQNQFGPFTLGSVNGSNPLPIELLYFDAVEEGSEVRCTWATATERINDYFTVERSNDGLTYEDVGIVEGAGDSWSTITYGLLDPDPLQGLSYYRLRQTDTDGTSTWSHAVPVYFEGADHGLIVLNDAEGVHVLHDLAAGGIYEIFDPAGRLVRNGILSSDRLTLPATGREPSAFVLVLRDGLRVERVKLVY